MTNTVKTLNELVGIYGEKNEFIKRALESLIKNRCFIDDHNGENKNLDSKLLILVAKNKNNDTYFVCPGFKGKYFCLNYMYADINGVAHLATASVGGVVVDDTNTVEGLLSSVKLYNDELMGTEIVDVCFDCEA